MTTSVENSPLFREEVLRARQVQWLGTIRIGRPLSFAWVTGISLLLAAALIAFSIWGEVTRKAKLPGLLAPTAGMLNLSAPQAGVVAELAVKEGELVREGQVLLRLKTERSTAVGDAGALNATALAQRRATLDTEALLSRPCKSSPTRMNAHVFVQTRYTESPEKRYLMS